MQAELLYPRLNDGDDDGPTERDLLIRDNAALRDALRPFAAIFVAAVAGDLDEKQVARFKGRGLFKGRDIVLTVGHFRQAGRVLRFGAEPITEDEAEYSDEEVAQALAEDWADAMRYIDRTRGTECSVEAMSEKERLP